MRERRTGEKHGPNCTRPSTPSHLGIRAAGWTDTAAGRSAARGCELFEGALQGLELLSRFAKFSLGREALVIGQVACGLPDEAVDVRRATASRWARGLRRLRGCG